MDSSIASKRSRSTSLSVKLAKVPFPADQFTAGPINGSRIIVPYPVAPQGEAAPGAAPPQLRALVASGHDIYEVLAAGPSSSRDAITGKEGVYMPIEAASHSCRRFNVPSMQGEIMSLSFRPDAATGGLLAAADDRGHCLVASCAAGGAGPDGASPSYRLMRAVGPGGQQGWAGAVVMSDTESVILARSGARDLQHFRGDKLVGRCASLYPPSAIRAFPEGTNPSAESLVACAEGPSVAMYDIRAGLRHVERLTGGWSCGDFLALDIGRTGGGGFIGAIGRDRSIQVWDSRTWKLEDRTGHVLRHEATSLVFSSMGPDLAYAGGLDYEICCGPWRADPMADRASAAADRASAKRKAVEGAGSGGGDGEGGAGDAGPRGRAVGPQGKPLPRPAAAAIGDEGENENSGGASGSDASFAVRVSGRSCGLAVAPGPVEGTEVFAALSLGPHVYLGLVSSA